MSDDTTISRATLVKLGEDISASLGQSKYNSYENCIRGIDVTSSNTTVPDKEQTGYTFFTRPRLNLSTPNIRSVDELSLLNSTDPGTVAFAMRVLLDTDFLSTYGLDTSRSPYVNQRNPFIPVLSNRCKGTTGWPDPVLEIETSPSGFFSESMTYPKGHDQLTKAYDIACTFSDIQGGFIALLMYMNQCYLQNMTINRVSQYMRDIEDGRQGYTMSIYRFTMDPSKKYILKWAKATGTWPRNISMGKYFDFSEPNSIIEAGRELSVTFAVGGKVDYLRPIILTEFNSAVKMYCPNIASLEKVEGDDKLINNHNMIPYINTDGTNELEWRLDNSSGVSTSPSVSSTISRSR